jgi:hypothetical protein
MNKRALVPRGFFALSMIIAEDFSPTEPAEPHCTMALSCAVQRDVALPLPPDDGAELSWANPPEIANIAMGTGRVFNVSLDERAPARDSLEAI